ncbi:AT-hook motif nuclear-localized protein 10 [Nymphaea colorata]|nr:AT-hook motif nuclear-localized protein 10 [Nymphaea colorata]XP_031473471.1 AT-hook motif nuclear-localized protein 10 [Nymphaea colorata]XP_031473472.1 AT-hook motif nuclear-localized protein 10 [Nymphaea colorata]
MEATEQQPRLPASEPGMMAGRESAFSVSLQKGSVPVSAQSPAASVQNMRLAFTSDGSAVYKPVTATSPPYQGDGSAAILQQQQQPQQQQQQQQQGVLGMGMAGGGPVKRKRGRPRKYGPDGTMALALTPVSSLPGGYSSAANPTSPTAKKARGRPPGSGKKQQLAALGSPGTGFMPHVITVKAGEDVASKIMSFSQQGPRAVCILSANGAISNVTLRQPATSGGTVTYEGRFEILSLSGSFLLSESGGQRSRTGGLSVSLAGPDGRVLGGGVAGLLMAASPVQVVVGSFIADGKKTEPKTADFSVPAKISAGGATAASSPPSRGTLSESSGGGPGSPLNQSTGACNNSQPGIPNIPWK